MSSRGRIATPRKLGPLARAARDLLVDLDLESVLNRVVREAETVTGSGHAVLGVLSQTGPEMARFIVAPSDHEVDAVAGTPAGSSLPVPIRVAGRPYGTLYVGEKRSGDALTEHDRRALFTLAEFAGVAIHHALRFRQVAARQAQLEQRVQALDATRQMARAIGGETDLEPVLSQVAEHARRLVEARAIVIEYLVADQLVVVATAGDVPADLVGRRVDVDRSLSGEAVRRGTSLRIEDSGSRRSFQRYGLGQLGVSAEAGLVVPLTLMGRAHGALIAIDRQGGPSFNRQDQRLLKACAEGAAPGLATAESKRSDQLRQRLEAAAEERVRWGRELHDDTLQDLAATRLSLAREVGRASPAHLRAVVADAVGALDEQISHVRALIVELRPTPLGQELPDALRQLADRIRARGLDVVVDVGPGGGADLPADEHPLDDAHLSPESASAIYWICHEAIVNVSRHAGASSASIRVRAEGDWVRLTICDDGCGFDPGAGTGGFGLVGMRERTELADGLLEIESSPGQGTILTAVIPARPPLVPEVPQIAPTVRRVKRRPRPAPSSGSHL